MNTNQMQNYQYNQTAEDIPLGKVSTFDDEQKYYHHEQQDTFQSQKNNRDSFNSIYQVKQSKFSLFAQPLLSVVLSAFFSIALLLLFLYADGKPLDHTLVGMKIPALVSLLLSINAIFLASGISKAVAEYKWVKLQNGAPLTMIDIYDACTRGISGFFMTLRALHFDIVLMIALFFHLGLLIVSPISQSILVPNQRETIVSDASVLFFYLLHNSTAGRSKLASTGQAPRMNGLNNGYISTTAFTQAAEGLNGSPIFICPNNAFSCVYPNVSFITTTMSCQNITSDDKALVYHNNTNNVVVLKEYLTNENITLGSTVGNFPKFFYSTDMLGRTSYELDNYKLPNTPGFNNLPLTLADIYVYDPQYRPYVGDQSFVMAYNTLIPSDSKASNYTELSYRKCSFKSHVNVSDWETKNGTLIKTGVETSVPIDFDYDNVLGNNVALYQVSNTSTTAIMVNAYLMQQTLLMELIRPKFTTMYDYLYSYKGRMNLITKDEISKEDYFERFMKEALTAFDFAFLQSPVAIGGFADTIQSPKQGTAYIYLAPEYKVKETSAYILCICLLLPIIWWIFVWLYSLKKNNGVARANSQIVLLATNMTPDAQRNLQGFSGLDSSNAFKRAKDIRIRLGLVQQHTVVGLDHENHIRPFNK